MIQTWCILTLLWKILQGFILRKRRIDVENLDTLMKTKNIPEAHQDAFKTGFAEGFLKAQVFLQKTLGKLFYFTYLVFAIRK